MDKYIGQMLDSRYEILEVIGTGGMAVVYKARCHRLNRFVAIKILKEEYAQDAEFRRRFHAESQAVAMLSQPNIVAVYDVSRSAETEFIVMELIDGVTLKQYMQLKGAPLNWREALHFAAQIVKALSHAHSRGIIHRDIKPHNIMILRDGSVKVADFGIARLTSVQNTLTQEALGSVHYISPEQARGSHIDARSDLYSVGVVLYEMLTGRLPYEGDSAVSVAIQHINSMPLSPREINPAVPAALETITMKAMSASVPRRYASAEAMLADLEEFRKNPSIRFDYDLSSLHPQEKLLAEEPTKTIRAAQTREALANYQQNSRRPDPRSSSGRRTAAQEVIEEEEDDYRRRTRNSKVTLITGVLAVLVFLAGMTFLVVTLLGGMIDPPEVPDVVVPSLLRLQFTDVENKKDTIYQDFIIKKVGEQTSDVYEAGEIMYQNPGAGSTRRKGTTIEVTVCSGREMVDIPNYVNKQYDQVYNDLKALGLNPDPEYIPDDEIVRDQVIRTDPPYGAKTPAGSTVKVFVSTGKETKNIEVPDFKGFLPTPSNSLQREVEKVGLTLGTVDEVYSEVEIGRVVWQSIPEGTSVAEKTKVNFTVSKGPEPTPTPTETPSPTPSEEPTTPPPIETITREFTVTLPTDRATVKIDVYVGDGFLPTLGEISTDLGTYKIKVTGHPDALVAVYFDGVQQVDNYTWRHLSDI